MRFVSCDLAEELSRFQNDKYLTTSFFLDTDKSRRTKKEIIVTAKNLLASGRKRGEELDAAKDKRMSVERDLAAIEAFVAENLTSNAPGLALYACAGAKLWEVFALPAGPRDRIVFDRTPYIRPLSLILDRFRPMLVLLLDRREARWFESNMGMLAPLAHLVSEVPKKVKGGVEGPEAKRVERHIDAVVLSHFKRAAKQTFDLFQKTEYAGLLVGCHNGTCGEFESVLHPYLKERLKGKLKSKPGDAPDKVLQECVALEKDLRKGEEDNLVARLLAEVEKGGRAVSGLRECLKRLNQGEVRELIVTRYFAAGGTSCPRCGLLYLDELRCPTCERKTVALLDVVDEAVQKAWERQCGVRHITPPSKLDRYGKIGVFLRYKA